MVPWRPWPGGSGGVYLRFKSFWRWLWYSSSLIAPVW